MLKISILFLLTQLALSTSTSHKILVDPALAVPRSLSEALGWQGYEYIKDQTHPFVILCQKPIAALTEFINKHINDDTWIVELKTVYFKKTNGNEVVCRFIRFVNGDQTDAQKRITLIEMSLRFCDTQENNYESSLNLQIGNRVTWYRVNHRNYNGGTKNKEDAQNPILKIFDILKAPPVKTEEPKSGTSMWDKVRSIMPIGKSAPIPHQFYTDSNHLCDKNCFEVTFSNNMRSSRRKWPGLLDKMTKFYLPMIAYPYTKVDSAGFPSDDEVKAMYNTISELPGTEVKKEDK